MNKYLILIFAITLLGCSTLKVKTEKMRILMLSRDYLNSSKACRAPIESNNKFSRIYEKFGVKFGDMPTEKQLVDDEVILESDISLGLDWYSEWQYCMANQIEEMGKIDPQMAIVGTRAMKKQVELIKNIVDDRPTYGFINKNIFDMKTAFKYELNQWANDLDKRLSDMDKEESIASGEVFISEIGNVSKKLAIALLETVGDLAEMELLLAQSAENYSATHPTYFVSPIVTTKCRWFMSTLSCHSY